MSISFDDEFEAIGEAEVRRLMLAQDNSKSAMLSYAPAWLSLKDSERIARSETREAMALSIAQDANDIASKARNEARRANTIATIAMILSATIAIISMYVQFN